MLVLLRILFGFALFSVFAKAVRLAGDNPNTEGTTDGGYVALAVGIGILNAIVWAPFVGRIMAEPLTGAFTSGHPADFTNRGLQFAHKLAVRGWRRWALFFAFIEGVRHPDMPGAFVLGLNQARAGTWLEKVFAREVWRFQNAENCLRAWKILKARGVAPDLHPSAEVNLLIQSQTREAPPPASVLAVPPAPSAPPPKRNAAIQLFRGKPAGAGAESVPVAPLSDSARPSEASALNLVGRGDATPPIVPAGGTVEVTLETGGAGESGAPLAQEPARLSMAQRLRVLFTGRPHP